MKPKPPFTARSASDTTDDWPFWFVADSAGLNVTVDLFPALSGSLPFLSREEATDLAKRNNITKA